MCKHSCNCSKRSLRPLEKRINRPYQRTVFYPYVRDDYMETRLAVRAAKGLLP